MQRFLFFPNARPWIKALVLALALALSALEAVAQPEEAAARSQARPGEYTGVVSRVVDGDTLWVALPAGSKPVKVRIDGIDAPEMCQAHGAAAKQALSQRLQGRAITVRLRARDNYGRRLGKVFDETEDVGEYMVRLGHAWSLRYRWDRGPYAQQESQARQDKLGLHADPLAQRPHLFRRDHGPCVHAGANKP